MKKDPLSILRKILASKDEGFALLIDSFKPVKFGSISKLRDFNGERQWKGESLTGDTIVMLFRDSYLWLGTGDCEVQASKNIQRVAYFADGNLKIEEIAGYLKVELPHLYTE
jgi:hypothetical protein